MIDKACGAVTWVGLAIGSRFLVVIVFQKTLGSLSTRVFETETAAETEHFAF